MAEIVAVPMVQRAANRRAGAGTPVVMPGLLLAMILVLAGCSNLGGEASYRPAFIPVKFTLDSMGDLKITSENSLVTPLGIISIGTEYRLPQKDDDVIRVIIRDGNASPDGSIVGFDHIYDVKSGMGEFNVVVDGMTTIHVIDQEVQIDVTKGTVQTLEFTGTEAVVKERTADIGTQWQEYWTSSFYEPFILSRWAYDDSTMSKWFGVGFAWFLVRLVAALILFVVDLILTVACFLAAVAFVIFGPTGQNIMYGLEALLALFVGRMVATDLGVML